MAEATEVKLDTLNRVLTSRIEDEEQLECGYGNCTPKWLQFCNVPKGLLLCICSCVIIQGFVVNGIVMVDTATIERRFDLPSSGVAWISSTYEISAAIFALVFGYMGLSLHPGRTLALCAIVMAFGSFTMSIPHWLAGEYTLGQTPTVLCHPSANSTVICDESSGPSNYLYVFLAGQILHGFGGGPLYTLGPPYLDENIKIKMSPVYIGIMLACSTLGAGTGYLLGGYMLSFYVDILRVDTNEISVDPADPRWVGAWWVGFMCSGCAFLMVAFFLGMFPRELPVAKVYRKERQSQAYKGIGENSTTRQSRSLKQVFKSINLFFTNPTWMFLTIGAISESGMLTGMGAFLPKVVQFQFNLPASTAAMYTGPLVLSSAVIGNIFGGFIPRWQNLRMRGLLIQCTVCSLIALPFSAAFTLRCNEADLAGVKVHYENTSLLLEETSLNHKCNSDCQCTAGSYDPICGVDNIGYFSPCYAGCTSLQKSGNGLTYHNCSCIHENTTVLDSGWSDIKAGPCNVTCSVLPYFLLAVFIVGFVSFASMTAGQSASLRCVPDKQRVFSNGIQNAIARLLGQVPGPLVLGAIFDKACVVWQDKCDRQASCWIYDGKYLALGLCFVIVVTKVISAVCFIIALVLYKPPPLTKETITMQMTKESLIQDDQVPYKRTSTSSTDYDSRDEVAKPLQI